MHLILQHVTLSQSLGSLHSVLSSVTLIWVPFCIFSILSSWIMSRGMEVGKPSLEPCLRPLAIFWGLQDIPSRQGDDSELHWHSGEPHLAQVSIQSHAQRVHALLTSPRFTGPLEIQHSQPPWDQNSGLFCGHGFHILDLVLLNFLMRIPCSTYSSLKTALSAGLLSNHPTGNYK